MRKRWKGLGFFKRSGSARGAATQQQQDGIPRQGSVANMYAPPVNSTTPYAPNTNGQTFGGASRPTVPAIGIDPQSNRQTHNPTGGPSSSEGVPARNLREHPPGVQAHPLGNEELVKGYIDHNGILVARVEPRLDRDSETCARDFLKNPNPAKLGVLKEFVHKYQYSHAPDYRRELVAKLPVLAEAVLRELVRGGPSNSNARANMDNFIESHSHSRPIERDLSRRQAREIARQQARGISPSDR